MRYASGPTSQEEATMRTDNYRPLSRRDAQLNNHRTLYI